MTAPEYTGPIPDGTPDEAAARELQSIFAQGVQDEKDRADPRTARNAARRLRQSRESREKSGTSEKGSAA